MNQKLIPLSLSYHPLMSLAVSADIHFPKNSGHTALEHRLATARNSRCFSKTA